jgi:hypothetical protein
MCKVASIFWPWPKRCHGSFFEQYEARVGAVLVVSVVWVLGALSLAAVTCLCCVCVCVFRLGEQL